MPIRHDRSHIKAVTSGGVTVLSTCCKAEFNIQATPEQVQDWLDGGKIQNVMPHLSADDRELLMTGTCGPCWNKLFAEEPDDETAELFRPDE